MTRYSWTRFCYWSIYMILCTLWRKRGQKSLLKSNLNLFSYVNKLSINYWRKKISSDIPNCHCLLFIHNHYGKWWEACESCEKRLPTPIGQQAESCNVSNIELTAQTFWWSEKNKTFWFGPKFLGWSKAIWYGLAMVSCKAEHFFLMQKLIYGSKTFQFGLIFFL